MSKINVLEQDGFVAFFPSIPTSLRANCKADCGLFLNGNDKLPDRLSEIIDGGYSYGSFIEMALCHVDAEKVLSFQPHFSNVPFTQIWGIPVAGDFYDKYDGEATELVKFLIHKQSRDEFLRISKQADEMAFKSFLADKSMDMEEHITKSRHDLFFGHIFRFEMTRTSCEKGDYYYVQATMRAPKTDLERKALGVSEQVFRLNMEGAEICSDPRIDDNDIQSRASLQEFLPDEETGSLQGKDDKKLTGAKSKSKK